MSTDKMVVIIGGFLSILFVFWFFLGKKRKSFKLEGSSVEITVDGGYSPEVISVSLGKTTQLNFTRVDPTDCLEELVLPDFKIKRTLPLNQKVAVEITPTKKGQFTYHCGMNMYHGRIIVE
ncbi:MAG: cupredoxin domain-containing protein [Patescibacteria group bacterium]